MDSPLSPLFQATSIAVVGASKTEGKAGHEMLKALQSFPGALYPINPKETEILGYRTYPSLSGIGNEVDLAILTLPASACVDAANEAAKAGVKALMIISGGFAEIGDLGQKLQQDLLEVCKTHGMRVLGPNTSGFATPKLGITASFAPGMDELSTGPVGIVAQSGAVNLTLCSMAADIGLGVSTAVGTGNGQDVAPADVIDHLTNDAETKVILVYLEGVTDGRKLYETILKCSIRKPIVIYTVGKADIGEFAASHTGNMMGSFDLKQAALTQAGAVLVDSLEDLINAALMFSVFRLKPLSNPGIALLTGQAGPGMIISDYLRAKAVDMPELNHATVSEIGTLLPPLTFLKNPVDTGRPGSTFPRIMELVGNDPNIDVVVTFVLNEPAALDPLELFSNQSSHDKPVVFGTAGANRVVSKIQHDLHVKNIPVFTSPDKTAQAMCALVEDATNQYRLSHRNDEKPLEQHGTVELPDVVDEAKAKELLRSFEINTPPARVCDNRDQIYAAFESLTKPCVLKILSSEITHKTEVGGVQLNLTTEDELAAAVEKIDAIEIEGNRRYLLESMAPAGLELIIGGKRDDSFGPSILLGLGGTQAEAFGDVAIRLCPINRFDAESMIEQLRGRELLNGWRGEQPVDKGALIETLLRVSRVIEENPSVQEIDLNPVRVYSEGIVALDALIVTR